MEKWAVHAARHRVLHYQEPTIKSKTGDAVGALSSYESGNGTWSEIDGRLFGEDHQDALRQVVSKGSNPTKGRWLVLNEETGTWMEFVTTVREAVDIQPIVSDISEDG